jgi:hypothetical protein
MSYTCSMMLQFKDEAHVDEWSARHRIPRGDVQPVAKVLPLATRWYGEHLRPDCGYVPDDQPGFEAWTGSPFAHGAEYFEVYVQLPIKRV